jgi:hypothetical protein
VIAGPDYRGLIDWVKVEISTESSTTMIDAEGAEMRNKVAGHQFGQGGSQRMDGHTRRRY